MNPELQQLAQRIASALLNGLYQGMILTLVLWIGWRVFRRTNAASRHAAAYVTLLLVAFLPVAHFIWAGSNQGPAGDAVESSRSGGPEWAAPDSLAGVTGKGQPELSSEQVPGKHRADEWALPSAEDIEQSAETGDNISTGMPLERSGARPHVPDDANSFRALASSLISFRLPFVEATVPGLVTALVVGGLALIAAIRLGRVLGQLILLRRLKRSGLAVDPELQERFDHIRDDSRVQRPVQLLISPETMVPMAIGYWRPAVLLPAVLTSCAEAKDYESVLHHELAHVQRRDDWNNLVQQVIHAVLFFHPAVLWLSRRLTIDREIACDDHALARIGSHHDYALFLAEFAGRSQGHDWIVAPAAWRSSSHLKERINMILDTQRNRSLTLARANISVITLATLATATVALIAGPRLVLADASGQAPAETVSPPPAANSVSSSGSSSVARSNGQRSARSLSVRQAPSDLEPVVPRSKSVITLRNDAATIVSTGDARPEVSADVRVAGPHPRVVVAHVGSPPEPPKPVRAPEASQAPSPPKAVVQADRASLEKRLDRLEKMIERLVEDRPEPRLKFSPDEGKSKGLKRKGNNVGTAPDVEHFIFKGNIDGHGGWPLSEEQRRVVEKSLKDAREQVARAMREFEVQVSDAELRTNLQERRSAQALGKDTLHSQQRILEQQKRDLERQVEELNRQIVRLSEQMKRLDAQSDRQNESADGDGFLEGPSSSTPKQKN